MPRGKSKHIKRVKQESKSPDISDRQALRQIQSDWRCAPQPFISPFTAGSSLAFLAADFNESHYKQQDISLNETLWSLWPVAPPDGYEKVLKQAGLKSIE